MLSFTRSIKGLDVARGILFGEMTAREVNTEEAIYRLVKEMDAHEQEVLLIYADSLLKSKERLS